MDNNKVNELINEILKDLFHQIMTIQERFVEKSSNIRLSRTEMHIIEIVGDNANLILTEVANKMYITKATASVCVERLVKKGYIIKVPLEKDKRKQGLILSQDGQNCNRIHEDFHEKMVEAITKDFGIEEKKDLVKSLNQLLTFFKEYY